MLKGEKGKKRSYEASHESGQIKTCPFSFSAKEQQSLESLKLESTFFFYYYLFRDTSRLFAHYFSFYTDLFFLTLLIKTVK